MKYPILYADSEQTFESFGLAILKDASDIQISERLNGEYSLTFSAPYTQNLREIISDAEYVRIEDIIFVIKRVTIEKTTSAEPIAVFEAEHIVFELRETIIKNVKFVGQTLDTIISALVIQHPRFEVGAWVDDTIGFDFEFDLKNAYECLTEIAETIGGEIDFDSLPNLNSGNKFAVGIRLPVYQNGEYVGGGKGGDSLGYILKVGKNIKSMSKEIDRTSFYNKMFYFGKDGLQFDNHTIIYDKEGNPLPTAERFDIPLGQTYFEEILDITDKVRVGFHVFSDISNKDELYWMSKAHFESVKRPRITYDIEVLDIKNQRGEYDSVMFDAENIQVGDIVTFYPEELSDSDVGDTRERLRVTEYIRFPLEPEKSRARFESVTRNVYYTFAEFVKTTGVVKSLSVKGQQAIDTTKLDSMYVVNREAVDDTVNPVYNGIQVLGQIKDGMIVALTDDHTNRNALFLGQGGDVWLYNKHGAGIHIGHGNHSKPEVRATDGTMSVIASYIGTPSNNMTLKWSSAQNAWIPSF